MNLVILHGRLTKEVEIKCAQSGSAFANFSIAVKREFAKEGQQDTDFFNCVAFGKTAETIQKFFNKGDGIIVKGKVNQDIYEKDGEKRTATKIVVESFDFAEKVGASSQANNNNENPSTQMNDDDELPF